MITYADTDGPNLPRAVQLLASLLDARGLQRIAVDAIGTSVTALNTLQAALPDASITDMSEWEGRIDPGNLRTYNDTLLEPDMVLSIEP